MPPKTKALTALSDAFALVDMRCGNMFFHCLILQATFSYSGPLPIRPFIALMRKMNAFLPLQYVASDVGFWCMKVDKFYTKRRKLRGRLLAYVASHAWMNRETLDAVPSYLGLRPRVLALVLSFQNVLLFCLSSQPNPWHPPWCWLRPGRR